MGLRPRRRAAERRLKRLPNYTTEGLEPRRLLAAIVSGQTATGSIGALGEVDEYTFSASVGDTIAVAIGETATANFDPRIQLVAPDSTVLNTSFGEIGTNIFRSSVTQAGTYKILVSDNLNNDTGNYTVTLAKVPGTHQAGGDSGAVTSGEYKTGQITAGDIDIYTIQGTAGGVLLAAVGDTGNTDFVPQIVAYNPAGVQLTFSFGDAGTNLVASTATTGTYTVLVIDRFSTQTGSYGLTITATPGPVVTDADSATVQSGQYRTGTIGLGDIDVYRIQGTAGGNLLVAVGDTGVTDFVPAVVAYSPTGAQLAFGFGDTGTNIFANTTTDGVYTVLVYDRFSNKTGSYGLTIAAVPATPITDADSATVQSGQYRTGTIDLGDIDIYRIQGTAGGNLLAAVGDTGGTDFVPEIVAYSPTGAQLTFDTGDTGTNIFASMATTGLYTIAVFDRFSTRAGSYALTITAVPATPIVDADSVTLQSGQFRQGTIDLGDIDVYRIAGTTGGTIAVAVGDQEPGAAFTPEIVLYSPTGQQLTFATGDTGANVFRSNLTATGDYFIAVFDRFSVNTGYYALTAVSMPATQIVDGDSKPLQSGERAIGEIGLGDIDVYTLNVAAGNSVLVTMTDLTLDPNFTPEAVLYSPTGGQITFATGANGLEINAANVSAAGTYYLVVFDRFSTNAGEYALSVAIPSAPPNNQDGDGGLLAVNQPVAGSVSDGDLDIYTFNLASGASATINISETVTNDAFEPVIWIYGPTGTSISRNTGAASATRTFTAPTTGTYTVVVYDDGGDETGAYSIALGAPTGADNFAPRAIVSEYRFNHAPPQLRVIFSENVEASFSAGDVQLINTDTNQPVNAANLDIDYLPGRDLFTVAFPGFPGGVLPDGNYSLRINAAAISDAAGNPMPANLVYDFFVLAGDFNRDKTVNDVDWAIFTANFEKHFKLFSEGDVNYNGHIGGDDRSILVPNFGKTVGPIGSLSGTVFNDPNSNGVLDAAETGLAGRIVYLDVNQNNVFDTGEPSRTTAANGTYSFAAIGPGNYAVRHVLPTGWRKTLPGAGVPGYNVAQAVSQNTTGRSFGNTTNILLAGTVFNDANNNGVKDGNEAGIAGVTVNIVSNATVVATRITDANGFWRVQGLSQGTGSAEIVIPATFTATSPVGGKYTGSMSSGQQNANLNFGLRKSSPAPVFAGQDDWTMLTGRYNALDFFGAFNEPGSSPS